MISIAIDGPAGAGKSTISRIVAGQLGFIYVDTGALYRAIGVYALNCGVNPKDTDAVASLLKNIEIKLKFVDHEQRVILNGQDVSAHIRTAEASMAASDVSALPLVRTFLFELQQSMARGSNVVMDGRDIGTVVLPNAQIKIYLTASPEDRAQRRFSEMKQKGMEVTYEGVLKDLTERDYNDSNRAVAPLKPAQDSIIVDTTGNTLEQSVEALTALIREKLAKLGDA
ncbi:MAG: cytidylate kinase [Clostridiales bacterium 43-6]|nr:MAG: cytidylate kinase [Clostridiales bacterium 43-6]